MPDVHVLLSFLAAAFVLAIMPGPGMLYVAARTLSGGHRDGMLSTAGTAIGGSVHVLAAAAGLSALLATSSVAFAIVKYAGAAYLIYLGIRMLLDRRSLRVDETSREPGWKTLRQGVLTEALNPKTALFFLAILPQFVDPSSGSLFVQAMVLGLISVILNTLVDVGAVVLAGTAQRRLSRTARWPRLLSGGTLIGLGGYAASNS